MLAKNKIPNQSLTIKKEDTWEVIATNPPKNPSNYSTNDIKYLKDINKYPPAQKGSLTKQATDQQRHVDGLQRPVGAIKQKIDLGLAMTNPQLFESSSKSLDINSNLQNNQDKVLERAKRAGIKNPHSKELLFTESKVTRSFDLLALRIHKHLEYPIILAEKGVEGTSRLDLVFDGVGEIDTLKSRFSGSNRSVRGLLVKAIRKGLQEWYAQEFSHLDKTQFRSQHFHAEFEISHTEAEVSQWTKQDLGSYRYLRRRTSQFDCISGSSSGISMNFACFAIKGYGFAKKTFSRKYQVQFEMLVELLEYYDRLGLENLELGAESI